MRACLIYRRDVVAGTLAEDDTGDFIFTYDPVYFHKDLDDKGTQQATEKKGPDFIMVAKSDKLFIGRETEIDTWLEQGIVFENDEL